MKDNTYLNLSGNDLSSIAGLSGLKRAFNIYLDNNPNLTSLSGLDNLEKIYVLDARERIGVTDLDPLSSLREAHALRFDRAYSLDDISALSGLIRVDEVAIPKKYGGYAGKLDPNSPSCDKEALLPAYFYPTGTNSGISFLDDGTVWRICDIGSCVDGIGSAGLETDGTYKFGTLKCDYNDFPRESFAFGDAWRNLKKINGDLIISAPSSVTSLDFLSGLVSVSGNVVVKGSGIEDISGLSNLSSVGENVIIPDKTYEDSKKIDSGAYLCSDEGISKVLLQYGAYVRRATKERICKP
jgi:hypothetical protein